jgi:hypothetical protein
VLAAGQARQPHGEASETVRGSAHTLPWVETLQAYQAEDPHRDRRPCDPRLQRNQLFRHFLQYWKHGFGWN